MKHTIVRYTLAIIGLFSVTSCTDYLDNAPDDILTLDMVFNSKNRTEEWLAGIYDGIPDPYTPMMRNYDAYADDFSPSQDWRAFSDWDCIDKILGNWTPQSEWKGNFWSDFPVRIREAYIFLDNVKALPEQEVYQADVDNMKAEARFLIAYYYYLLVNTYGAIPFQTSLVDMNDPIDKILIGQTPYDQIIDWLDKEFKAVSELLPPSYTEERKYGRATSVMALAIRARMLLFAASPLVNGNDDPDYAAYTNNKGEAIFNSTYDPKKWERAVNACKDLLTEAEGNGYALYKEYNGDGSIDPFMSYSNMCYKEFNQGNKEILFARPDVSYDLYSQHSVPRGSRGQGGLGVTQELVDAFFMSNGLPAITGYEPNGEPIINKASGYNEKRILYPARCQKDQMDRRRQRCQRIQHRKYNRSGRNIQHVCQSRASFLCIGALQRCLVSSIEPLCGFLLRRRRRPARVRFFMGCSANRLSIEKTRTPRNEYPQLFHSLSSRYYLPVGRSLSELCRSSQRMGSRANRRDTEIREPCKRARRYPPIWNRERQQRIRQNPRTGRSDRYA